MSKFTCTICNSVLINHGHSCGREDCVHIVEVVNGGGSWGRPNIGGREDKENI